METIAAWQRGFTGRNVVVGVIDDGLHPTDPEIAGRVHPASTDIVTSRGSITGAGTHGTELAAFIAGAFNNASTVGVAYNATILGVRADDPACTTTNCGFRNADLAAALTYAVDNGAKVVNFSLGSTSPSSTAFVDAIRYATSRGVIIVISAGNEGTRNPGAATEVNYPARYITDPSVSNGLIIAAGASDENGQIVSFSNRAGASRDFYVLAPGLRVFTVDTAAPGATDPAFQTCFPDRTCQMQGTSYSSPHVTGMVALLLEAFPGLTPTQVVQLVLRSATDVGDPGTDVITGRGLANVRRAFEPIGALSAPVSASNGAATGGGPLGKQSAAFGDAFSAPGAWSSVAFDEFGRTFAIDLSQSWVADRSASDVSGSQAPRLWRQAQSQASFGFGFGWVGALILAASEPEIAPPQALAFAHARNPDTSALTADAALSEDTVLSMGFATSPWTGAVEQPDAPSGHFTYGRVERGVKLAHRVADNLIFSVGAEQAERAYGLGYRKGQISATRMELSGDEGALRWTLGLGAITEEGGVLGASWNPLWGAAPNAETHVARLAGRAALSERVALSGEVEAGRTDLTSSGWMRLDDALATSAASLRLERAGGAGIFRAFAPEARSLWTLTLSQPLRVEDGAFRVAMPTANEWGVRSLRFVDRRIDATPQGREMKVGLGYQIWARDKLSGQVEASWRAQPDHRRDAEAETALRAGLRLKF
jgi:hypothetical protein